LLFWSVRGERMVRLFEVHFLQLSQFLSSPHIPFFSLFFFPPLFLPPQLSTFFSFVSPFHLFPPPPPPHFLYLLTGVVFFFFQPKVSGALGPWGRPRPPAMVRQVLDDRAPPAFFRIPRLEVNPNWIPIPLPHFSMQMYDEPALSF